MHVFIQVCVPPGNSHTWHIRHLSQGWYDICIFIPLPPFSKTCLPSTIPLFQNFLGAGGPSEPSLEPPERRTATQLPAFVVSCVTLCRFFFKKNIYLFIWFCQSLVAALRIFAVPRGFFRVITQILWLRCAGLVTPQHVSSQTRDQTHIPCTGPTGLLGKSLGRFFNLPLSPSAHL